MIATKSPLILQRFTIIDYVCNSEPLPDTDNPDFKDIQNNYPIDINFDIDVIDKTNDHFLVFIDIKINPENSGGYSLFAKGVGIFSFTDDQKLTDDEKRSLVQFSAVSICITNLRAYIANVTSYFPFGAYQFAAIDMNDLLQQKVNEAEVDNNNEQSKVEKKDD